MRQDRRHPRRWKLLTVFTVLLSAPLVHSQEWTRFRGPNGSGINQRVSIPAVWAEKDFRWKISLPGDGHSSPVLWGHQLFVTSADDSSAMRRVVCIDAHSGATVWKREFGSHLFHQHGDNSYASSTPAVDGRHLYVCWNTPEEFTLVALNLDGSDAWKADMGPFVSQHGGGNSPIVVGNVVILGDDNEGKESFLFGFDASSGKMLWKLPRQSDKFSAATPCVYTPASGSAQVIFTSKAHGMTAVDPVAGKVVWQVEGLFDLRTVSSPITGDGLIFATCGEGGGGHVLVAVKPGDGAGLAPQVAYKVTQNTPYVPTPLFVKDLLFLLSDGGMVTCARAATGQVIWQQRIGGSYYGSPVCAGDTIFCVSKKEEVVAIAASDSYKLLGRTRLDLDAKCHSTPALANGDMFVRTYSHLVCIAGNIGPQ